MAKTSRERRSQDQFLDQHAQRLLRWLRRYPFQRAQDLVVALAPWASRATVYRALGVLEKQGLLNVLRPGLCQGQHLFHLSPRGLSWCARLPDEQEQIRPPAEERARLARMIVRLPVWLPVQDLVNSLVTGAAEALTQAGRRARLVRWNWLRDYTPVFRTRSDDRARRLHVDAVLTLCLRFTPSGAGPTMQPLQQWYTLFVLHCPLDDRRLLRARFAQVLRWRESAERWPVYSQMPLLLVLATTPRQAEWWQQAARQVSAALQVDLPEGAIACLPEHTPSGSDGWYLAWYTLGTQRSCHLQDLLRPQTEPGVSELREVRSGAGDRAGDERRALSLPNTASRGPVTRSTYALMIPTRGVELVEKDAIRLGSVRLVPRQWEMLHQCHAHPLLSREDLCALLGLGSSAVSKLLADLRQTGFLCAVKTEIGERWCLNEAGLRLLAEVACCHIRRLAETPQEQSQSPLPLRQRGVKGLLRQVHHTAGVYGFFAGLASVLADRTDARLSWWETGVACGRSFIVRGEPHTFRPDALAGVQMGHRHLRFWLEWDRGTMNTRDLREKAATYQAYLLTRAWASEAPSLPVLLAIVPEVAQERRLARVFAPVLAQMPAWQIYTTTAFLLVTQGVLASIWRQFPDNTLEEGQPEKPRVSLFAT